MNFDALLVSNFYNILYLTGFRTLTENEREAFTVVTKKNIYLISDGRYFGKNPVKNQNFKLKLITPERKLIQRIQDIIKDEKIKKLGIEGEDLRIGEFSQLKEKLSVGIVSTNGIIMRKREIKKGAEIEKIRQACRIGDQCLSELIKTITVGQTEKEIAWRLEKWIKEKGYELAFDPIVAIDKNSSIPHYLTKEGKEKVKKNSIILIDFGVKYKNYCSDITRMIFFGKQKQEIFNIYNKLLLAQEKTIGYLNSIKFLNSVDSFCRNLLTSHLHLPSYAHSTGHGVGLEVHEYPKVSNHSDDILKKGQAFTIEPGVYFEGKWGGRIEDTVAIDDKLNIIVLTKFPKQILIRY